MSNDTLGDRIKAYENITRTFLPRRSNVVIRIDGKAFHTYTKGCDKPFDKGLQEDMNATAIALCENIQGAKLAYVQSDEITIVVTDYDTLETNAWFGNNIQKMVSVSASIATAEFNRIRMLKNHANWNANRQSVYPTDFVMAHFDSRIFTVPELAEVANTIIWRVQDATRNSIQMVARSLYSHKELEGKNTTELIELINAKGKPWSEYDSRSRFGGLIRRVDGVWKVVDIPEEHKFNYWNDLLNEVCVKN
jgi:tRNA(His) 5'-end guanylyltransferase